MKNTKKILAGIMALSMTAALTACGDNGTEGGNTAEETTTVTTTTAKTVAINDEGLKDGEQESLDAVMEQLQDVEMENKTVKWLAHYDLNPSTTGASKSVGLEMFEQKYGGKLEWIPTTWNSRYDDLSTQVLGGGGVDIFPGDDTANFPKGIINGMFQPVDDYIDINSAVWQNVSAGMDLFKFGGKHFELVTSITPEAIVIYDKSTIEAQGFDDPWELYEKGDWNWDTFKSMLFEFVDPDSSQYGLDGYWNEKALLMSAGVPMVGLSADGGVQSNVNDPTVEKAMNFQYELNQNGCKFPKEQFSWNEQPQMLGEGAELFYIVGPYCVQAAPETWSVGVEPENLGVVPVPSPAGSDPYQGAKINGFALCKGAANPQGAALFAECNILGAADERAIAISDRKASDDYKWSQEIIDKMKEIEELARKYPVVEYATGCSSDIASITTDGGDQMGMRAAFDGTDWATMRETIADTVNMLVEEVDQNLKTAINS
ncbi:MAG: ABC transporter substrate-binding protein [Oscillospiraceae bacterium]